MKLTPDQIKDLAECERMMDNGAPFVMLDGNRCMVSDAAMKEFGLQQGQTINSYIFCAILEFNLAGIAAGQAIKKAQATASKTK